MAFLFFGLFACSSNNPSSGDGGNDPDAIATEAGEAGACTSFKADDIYAGSTHACAKKSDGSIVCWGLNTRGALGDGTTDGELCIGVSQNCRSKPVAAKIMDVASVAIGDHSTCAIKKDGTLWCWGNNGYGELGDGTTMGSACMGFCEPNAKQVALGTVVSASVAQQHACAVKTDGTAWCWGVNGSAQLGDGTTGGVMCGGLQCRLSPVQVVGLTNIVEVSAGYVHSCARKMDGSVWCWGDNNDGAIGDGTMGSPYKSTAVAAMISGVAQVGVGDSFTCARKTDGTVWCWGDGQFGAIGNGALDDQALPVQVTTLGSNVVDLSVGRYAACARKNDGTAWCWGRNINGQLGDGQTKGSQCNGACENVPVQLALGMDVGDVAMGSDFGCGRKKDGTVVCWGSSMTGELGIGTFRGQSSCGNTYCEPTPVPACL